MFGQHTPLELTDADMPDPPKQAVSEEQANRNTSVLAVSGRTGKDLRKRLGVESGREKESTKVSVKSKKGSELLAASARSLNREASARGGEVDGMTLDVLASPGQRPHPALTHTAPTHQHPLSPSPRWTR